MISARWLEKRKPYWDRLEAILQRSGRRGPAALTIRELQETALLYRQVACDLASVREDPASRRLAGYLNQLLGRAHNLVYRGRAASAGGVLRFYLTEFPRVFRATRPYWATACALFLAGAVAGLMACVADPAFPRYMLGPRMMDTIERREMWTHSILAIKPLASSGIMTNNLTVSFVTFALGITGGLGTIWMMALNGVLIGVIGTACFRSGMSVQLWSFVAPHGVLELPAIFIAGAGGLLVARGLLFPGLLARRDALVHYGGLGVRLVLGVIPLLVVAGIIEAFFSPTGAPAPVKFAFAAGLAGLFALYLSGTR